MSQAALRFGACLVFAVCLASSGGCKIIGWFFDHQYEAKPGDPDPEQLWKEGYGFNNPNADKLQAPKIGPPKQ